MKPAMKRSLKLVLLLQCVLSFFLFNSFFFIKNIPVMTWLHTTVQWTPDITFQRKDAGNEQV